ncbi:class I SAM-dependent methyltransferase [Natronorubrum sp. DTA7]|uniref:class I SAM-dependent methyltransferase n=1 Tax=Natronorubrum sp. DTA7 TaxID=3447016 RepID=UPI003F838BDC
MKATRLEDCFEDPSRISSEFGHMKMYTGMLSKYYYKRFDYALRQAQLKPSDSVLIIGGGTGVFALTVAPLVNNLQFTDVPRENPPFATAKKLFQHSGINDSAVDFLSADATELPYGKCEFDVVFALDVLEHIPNEDAAISEIGRVTKTDGKAIVSAPIEVGVPLLVRETYRFLDGGRRHTKSLNELVSGVVGSPNIDESGRHRGYDYRETVSKLEDLFNGVWVDYCPVPIAKWLNPTAIITANHTVIDADNSPKDRFHCDRR